MAFGHGLRGMLKAGVYWPHLTGTGRKEIVYCSWLISKGTFTRDT